MPSFSMLAALDRLRNKKNNASEAAMLVAFTCEPAKDGSPQWTSQEASMKEAPNPAIHITANAMDHPRVPNRSARSHFAARNPM